MRCFSPDQWQNQIGSLFPDLNLHRGLRYYLDCKDLRYDWRAILLPGYKKLTVDAELMEQSSLNNMDELLNEMQSERCSGEDFLKQSFGFCMVHDQALVSWCLSEYNSGERCEVGVATQKEFRGLG
jgi:hypothetical protein